MVKLRLKHGSAAVPLIMLAGLVVIGGRGQAASEAQSTTWAAAIPALPGSGFLQMVADPTQRLLYAFGFEPRYTGVSIYASSDGGQTWMMVKSVSAVPALPPNAGIAAATDGTVYISDYGRILRSADAGLTWQLIRNETAPGTDRPSFGGVATDPIDAATVYATVRYGADPGIVKSTDAGETWRRIPFPDTCARGNAGRISVDHRQRNTLYAVSGICFYRSDDSGETWVRVSLPFPGTVEAFTSNPSRAGHIYLGTPDDGLWVSTDFGDSWVELPGLRRVRLLAMDARDSLGNSLFAWGWREGATEEGLYWTPNRGESWQAIESPTLGAPGRYRTHPLPPRFLVATADTLFTGTNTGLWATSLP
jgi:photosystem II stability/assembly factor-like uncharacterized protein